MELKSLNLPGGFHLRELDSSAHHSTLVYVILRPEAIQLHDLEKAVNAILQSALNCIPPVLKPSEHLHFRYAVLKSAENIPKVIAALSGTEYSDSANTSLESHRFCILGPS